MVSPTSLQYNPHMLLSDTHMGSTINMSSPLGNPSISPRVHALYEDMDHLLPPTDYDIPWYGGDSSLTLSDAGYHYDGSPDDGIGQRSHFPADHASLNAVLPAFAFLLDLYLPQVRSLVFLVDDTDTASCINEAIQELRHPFREPAGTSISRLSGRAGNIASIAGLQ